MKYILKRFQVGAGTNDAYRENYDRIFGKEDAPPQDLDRCIQTEGPTKRCVLRDGHECTHWFAE